MNEAPGESLTGQLDMMDRYEREGQPKSGLITNVEADLNFLFGRTNAFSRKIAAYTAPLRRMLMLIRGEKPPAVENIEGRGWHLETPYGLVYIKGIGNERMQHETRAEEDIPGYPTESTKIIMYDSLDSDAPKPRPLGTLSITQALLEYATNLVRIV